VQVGVTMAAAESMCKPSDRIVLFSTRLPCDTNDIRRSDIKATSICGLEKKAAAMCKQIRGGDTSSGVFTNAVLGAIFPDDSKRDGPVFVIAPPLGKSCCALIAAYSAAYSAQRRSAPKKLATNHAPHAVIVKQSTDDVKRMLEIVKGNKWSDRSNPVVRCLNAPWSKNDLVS
jgi:hypothetical protein